MVRVTDWEKNPCLGVLSVGDTIWFMNQCNPGVGLLISGNHYFLDKARTPDVIPDDLVHIERWL